LFLAIIKLAEDQLNVEHDTRLGDVRSLILVEDNVSFYSSYLPMIFSELVKQTESLISDEVNLGQAPPASAPATPRSSWHPPSRRAGRCTSSTRRRRCA